MLSALTASACVGERLQLPDFDIAQRSGQEATGPTDYPVLCEIPDWDAECWQIFEVYEDVADGNYDLAKLNAEISQDSDKAYDAILSAAKRQQEIAMIREEMLEQERRDHFLDNWFHRGLIAIGIAVAL